MTSSSTRSNNVDSQNSLALGPDLPLEVFTSTQPWHAERVGALALYCSDGRWGEAFDQFCHKYLGMPRYDRWAVPGGPAWLAAAEGTREYDEVARQQLDFLVQFHELERIVLITHYGCAAYWNRLRKSPQDCLPAQTEDVFTAADRLRNRYVGMRVEGYLAMCRGRTISFHELDVLNGSSSEPRTTRPR
jgi:hypothetical protein